MARIVMNTDCGNSPKKQFLKAFNVAFVEGDRECIAAGISPDVQWEMVGAQRLVGKEAFLEEFDRMKSGDIVELVIQRILTHGREGAVSGDICLQDGRVFAFCDLYEFKDAKGSCIRGLQSFVIEKSARSGPAG